MKLWLSGVKSRALQEAVKQNRLPSMMPPFLSLYAYSGMVSFFPDFFTLLKSIQILLRSIWYFRKVIVSIL